MALLYNISDGSTTVSLTSATVFQGRDRGPLTVPIASGRVVESVRFKLRPQADHDTAATQFQTLQKLLRAANEYHEWPWRKRPVYIEQRSEDETNTRYALVYEARDLQVPDLAGYAFEKTKGLPEMEVTLVRAHPWGSGIPGVLPSAATLGVSNGPTAPTMVHVANFRDDGNLTHVFHYDDSLTTFSSNLLSAANGTGLFPATSGDEDILYFGSSDIAFKHVCLSIATAMVFTGTIRAEYYDGSAWANMTLGTEFTLFRAACGELTAFSTIFEQVGLYSFNIVPPSDWAKTTINGENNFWFRLRIEAFTSMGTVPTKNGDAIYAQRSPFVDIPAATLKGDSPPTVCLRMWTPSGGDENEGFGNTSRILVGAKSDRNGLLTSFVSHLNAGGADNPAAWTTAYGSDGSSVSDNAAPGGSHAAVSFASDSTMVYRVRFTGDNLLKAYEGEYLAMARVQQIGGAAGDIKLKLRALIGGAAVDNAYVDLPVVLTRGADDGPEVLPFGLLTLPILRTVDADSLDTMDLVLEVHAERVTGAATLRVYDLILLPTDEWSSGVDDFSIDEVNGNGALRGGNALDLDGGILGTRVVKYSYDGTNLVPVDQWAAVGRPVDLRDVGVQTRLFFVQLHFPSTSSWGAEPLVASIGSHFAAQVFFHYRYAILRGSD